MLGRGKGEEAYLGQKYIVFRINLGIEMWFLERKWTNLQKRLNGSQRGVNQEDRRYLSWYQRLKTELPGGSCRIADFCTMRG